MKLTALTRTSWWWLLAARALALSLGAVTRADEADAEHLSLSSETFQNNGVVPDVMANTSLNQAGANVCTLDGLPGGNESPQLSWANPPPGTLTYAVVMYDETASFTHWALYNISHKVNSLAANQAPDTPIGTAVFNDFFVPGYQGPCPPIGVKPTNHRYTITVYALSDHLEVTNLRNFPAFGESVYWALIKATRAGIVLRTATLTVFDSATPAAP